MTVSLPGVSGTLFPSRYLVDHLPDDAAEAFASAPAHRRPLRLAAWWRRIAETCGPATGLRALSDLVAMPLMGALGFRAADPAFGPHAASWRLLTPGRTSVGLVVLPWATGPSGAWRRPAALARALGTRWCFIVAPPFLSLVAARGHAIRESVDFTWPDVLDARSLAVLSTIAHAGAFEGTNDGGAPIDALAARAMAFQDRVRGDLQKGVVAALATLVGVPCPGHGAATPAAAFDEALTVIYRILFLLFAEARELVPHAHPLYREAYAIGALCRQARTNARGTGLWEGLAAVTRLSRIGCRTDELIVRPFNGRLFARAAAPSLEARSVRRGPTRISTIRDAAMRETLVALATRQRRDGREDICYADLGVEQLGAVYERVLDIDPAAFQAKSASPPVGRLRPRPAGSPVSRRKRTGSFYTPLPLAEFVVRRTLSPLVSGRLAGQILALRVVDPAMGSGAFLVAACRFLAAAYERALIDDGECTEADVGERERADFRRLVAERCLVGVDVNPVAVQLARLSLWLATLAHGKPLGFLDHRLRVGNSLMGIAPEDLVRTPRRHRPARPSALPLLDDPELERSLRQVARPLIGLVERRDDTVADVHAKAASWAALTDRRSPLASWRLACHLWCARWFWPGRPPSPQELHAAIDGVLARDATLSPVQLAAWTHTAQSLAASHRMFHWPLEFPDVFYDAAGRPKPDAGFDAVIGNPPWEMLRREATGEQAPDDRPDRAIVRFIRESGLYPDCDRGHVNLYQPFLERAIDIARPAGRVGLVLPWGLAADAGAAALRGRLLDRCRTDTLVGLDNAKALFPIHPGLRFLVVVTSAGGRTIQINARFGVRTAEALDGLSEGGSEQAERSSYPVRLTRETIGLVGGAGLRIPDVRRMDDLAFAERVARTHPPFGAREGWHLQFGRELNATENGAAFGAFGLPVIEGKHIGRFRVDAAASARRVTRVAARRLLPDERFGRPRLAYRDVSGVSNRWSLIAAVVPADVVTTHTLFCLRDPPPEEQQHFLCGLFNSFVLNALVRMLMSGHVTTSLIEALPGPVWAGTRAQRAVARLARRLAAAPNRATSAALQAVVADLYGMDRETFARLLEMFPLVPAADRHAAQRAFARRLARRGGLGAAPTGLTR